VLLSAAILQLPSGEFLLSAKEPKRTIFCPDFLRGKDWCHF
jgi:hypothetical protein